MGCLVQTSGINMNRFTYKKKYFKEKYAAYFAFIYFMKCKLCFNPNYTVVKAAGGIQIHKN